MIPFLLFSRFLISWPVSKPCTALIAQLVEHGSNKPRVGGSSPSWSIFYFAIWQHAAVMPLRAKKHFVSTACWFINNSSSLEVEHRSYEPGVAGSIPAWSTRFSFSFCWHKNSVQICVRSHSTRVGPVV